MKELADKKTLWIFQPKQHVGLSSLMVYAYRSYQDEYDRENPSCEEIASATGLSRHTVRRADIELLRLGLMESDRSPKYKEGLFAEKPSNKEHWRHRLAYWVLYVRSLASPLTHIQSALWSYLWHCAQTQFEPKRGWSQTYLASVLQCNRRTIEDSLDALQEHKFLFYKTARILQNNPDRGATLKLTLFKPSHAELAYFQDKKIVEVKKRPCTIEVREERKLFTEREVFDQLRRYYSNDEVCWQTVNYIMGDENFKDSPHIFMDKMLAKLEAKTTLRIAE